MTGKNVSKLWVAALFVILVACGLCACDSSSEQELDDGLEMDQTDQMYQEEVYGATMHVFRYDGQVFDITSECSVDVPESFVPDEGGFYEVTADVMYLNGGIAGYVNYPDVRNVVDSKPVSPMDIGLGSIEDGPYGVVLIGDYADGDVFMRMSGNMAVWKDGQWVYRYSDTLKLDDGTDVCVREGVDAQDVQAGMDEGVLSCADYFVLPTAS